MTNQSRHKHTKAQNTGINAPPQGRGGVFHGRWVGTARPSVDMSECV